MWTLFLVFPAASGAAAASGGFFKPGDALWALQIALNTLWTPVFFGAPKKGAGFAIIGALWLTVAAAVWQFWALDWLAGLLMVPYLAWLCVASALNFRVWRDNPEPA
ncbi:TspO/MBR family protein [Phaeovulum sp.]|uniref:TspO/MBR family protein n=1 Tax=Phaeovulum sp. TaxID=2934796 RepID=UPI00273184B3|nr:TspO/MBR family protein [Phaeovulum sp.]MDP1669008.1 TspO/MBR family protein [Phaeovulum sp.]MDZ4117977.1 TspO/MBR family protein [Phaeovulum sp.]